MKLDRCWNSKTMIAIMLRKKVVTIVYIMMVVGIVQWLLLIPLLSVAVRLMA